ncbi:hypothetical protein DL96DRAFT_558161 [Flagelloscypha sp. PMI_526]|nr:hypothetical protein DL96DRAFT_558161 [Flagelloscypha sp. PMI_526]
MLCKLSFRLQLQTVPVELIEDSLILHQESASASASPQRPPCPTPLALASSGAAETGSLPVTKLYIPPPVPRVNSPRLPKRVPPTWPLSSPPRSNIQGTSIGQEESVIEKDSRPLIRRTCYHHGTLLPQQERAARTGVGGETCRRGRITRRRVFSRRARVAPLKTSLSGGSKASAGSFSVTTHCKLFVEF